MIDNTTGHATRVDLYPVQLEVILKTGLSRPLVAGWVLMQLTEAAKKLAPDFDAPTDERPLVGFPSPPSRVKNDGKPFMPRWRRWVTDDYDDDGGI